MPSKVACRFYKSNIRLLAVHKSVNGLGSVQLYVQCSSLSEFLSAVAGKGTEVECRYYVNAIRGVGGKPFTCFSEGHYLEGHNFSRSTLYYYICPGIHGKGDSPLAPDLSKQISVDQLTTQAYVKSLKSW